jgi:uncharacterized protein YndB with AHSA1/START domain
MPVGRTRDVGWEIGVSRTLPVPAARIWEVLTSPGGTDLWLGSGVSWPAEAGTPYELADGTRGEIRSFRPLDRIRLTWQPEDWDHESTVQVAISDQGAKTRITFHQERLADAEERERQRAHWKTVMACVEAAISGPGDAG